MGNYVSIYKYDDYRIFLSDYFEQRRKEDKYFSLRQFASSINLKSHTLLSHIVKGDRKITSTTFDKLIKGLKLSQDEIYYFKILIEYTNEKDIEKKRELFQKLNSCREKSKYYQLKKDQYRYFDKWFIPVLRELIAHSDAGIDPNELSKLFISNVSSKEIKDIIDFFFEKNLLKYDSKNNIKQTQNMILPGDIPYFFIKRARDKMIDMSKEMLDIVDKNRRYYINYTFSLSEKNYQTYIDIINDFENRIENLILNEKSNELDKVYQFNLQFFPLTHNFKKQKG